ncbi:uncharacterized protein [Temnothorax longispinosus]|uniref:uncharacterized protein n=1 Tax=Temnothorax longispinosus TaxID=300112 RepID=UPI003A999B1C
MQETSLQQEKCVDINSVEDYTLERQILRAIIVEDTKEQNFNADIPNNSFLISTHEPLTIVTTPKQQNFNADIPNNSLVISTSEILTIVTTPKQNFNADIPNNNSLRSPETVNTVTPVLGDDLLIKSQTSGSGVKRRLISDDEYDLETILNKSEEGQFVLGVYRNKGRLNNDLRNKLAKIIVSNELSPDINYTLNNNRVSFLSKHVKKLFPTEEKSVWYIKNERGESQGKGKILTRYYATRRKLIKAGLINVKASTTENNSKLCLNELNDDDIDGYEEYLLWLKNNSNPWPKVSDYWSLTFKKRLENFASSNQSCHEYMDQFP